VVGGDAAADEAEGGGEAVEEVDLGVRRLALEDVLGGVEAGGAGADDGDSKWVLLATDLGHGVSPAGGSGERERIGKVGPQPRAGEPAGTALGVPSSASRALPTDIATQVKIGVSRR
jgi:hypothetical protein